MRREIDAVAVHELLSWSFIKRRCIAHAKFNA